MSDASHSEVLGGRSYKWDWTISEPGRVDFAVGDAPARFVVSPAFDDQPGLEMFFEDMNLLKRALNDQPLLDLLRADDATKKIIERLRGY